MTWFEDPLKIVGLPEDHSASIYGTLDNGVVQIFVEHDAACIVEWSKAIPVYRDDNISYDDIREKYWGHIMRIRAKHENMKYDEWRQYFAEKVSKVSRL